MKSMTIALSLAVAASTCCARAPHAPAASDAAATTTVAADGSAQAGTPQRSKMKTCNADAKTKDVHGADRRAFMKQCLSGKSKPATAS
jgi:psiF repeat